MKRLWLAFLLLVCAGAASAGNGCAKGELAPTTVRQALMAAQAVVERLDREHATSGLIARVGKDLSKYGLKYSHVAFFRRDPQSGQWRIFHLLNECGTQHMDLWEQGIGNFFADSLFRYDALILIPSQETQARIGHWLDSAKSMRKVFGNTYNMLAYPFSTQYQNSNQWVLEALANILLDASATPSREKAQQWLREKDYRPSTIELGAIARFAAKTFKGNIAFDDHPRDRRGAGHIDVVTVDSVASFIATALPEFRKIEVPPPAQ